MNYTATQVKPIIDRILQAQDAQVTNVAAKQAARDGLLGLDIEHEQYTLRVFYAGISLLRDGVEIHHSRAKITHISKYFRR